MFLKFYIFILTFLISTDVYAKTSVKVETAQKLEFYEELFLPARSTNLISKDFIATTPGTIDYIGPRSSSSYKKGDLIIAIDKDLHEAKLKQAESDYRSASAQLKRDSDLHNKKFLSPSDYEKSKIAFYKAETLLAETKRQYGNMVIYAPYDCEVSLINKKEGDTVQSGDFIVTISATNDKKIQFSVPSVYKIAQDKVEGRILDNNRTYLLSKIFISQILDNDSLGFAGEATLSEHNNLQHNGYVSLNLRFNFHEGVGIPEKAVIKSSKKSRIYVVNDKNKATLLDVELKDRKDGYIEVISDNVKAGDIIITEGIQKLSDAIEVEVIE